MSDSNDTSAIDQKNAELNSSNSSNYLSNVGSFLLNVFIIFIVIVVYFGSGGLILYSCKLGQSNILPTDDCFPYNDTKPNIQPIKINIFNTIFSDPPASNKINFPYDDYNSSNKILELFLEYKNESNSNFLANYFISIMEKVTKFNYTTFNFILNLFNEIPEFLIVLFGPIIISIILSVIFIIDHVYLLYLWFASMSWFFKTNTNTSGTGKPNWDDVTFLNYKIWFSIGFIVLFIILLFFALPFLSFIALLSMSWCIFSCITYKAELNGKPITSMAVIQDVYKYYKLLIVILFSIFVIVSAFSKLGTGPGIFSIITLILIYFGIISIDIFKPISKENLTTLTSYKQAKKTCSITPKIKVNHGLLYDMIFDGGQNGGNITKELKKLGKKLSSK